MKTLLIKQVKRESKKFIGTWYHAPKVGNKKKEFDHYVASDGTIYKMVIFPGGSKPTIVDSLPQELLNVEEHNCIVTCGPGEEYEKFSSVLVPKINFVNHWLNNQYKNIQA